MTSSLLKKDANNFSLIVSVWYLVSQFIQTWLTAGVEFTGFSRRQQQNGDDWYTI